MYFLFDQLQTKSFSKTTSFGVNTLLSHKSSTFQRDLPVKSFPVFDFNETAWKIELRIECGDKWNKCTHSQPTCHGVLSKFSMLFVTEGPCLIHTMLGDLLRSLDPPPLCTDPQSLLINREGYITCVYNSTHVCLYNLNGRPLLH